MWANYFRRWMEMVFWWLPRGENRESDVSSHRQATPRTPPPGTADQREESVQRVEPERVVQVDDLTELKGIGETMQLRLRELGIQSFAELADADTDRLTEQLKAQQMVISRERVADWVASARERR